MFLHTDIQIVLRWTYNWLFANINDTMKEYLWTAILEKQSLQTLVKFKWYRKLPEEKWIHRNKQKAQLCGI